MTTTNGTDGGPATPPGTGPPLAGAAAAHRPPMKPLGAPSATSPDIGRRLPARPPLLMDVAIRCTAPSCSCECFSPCKSQIRMCDGCGHGWISHALDKLGFRHLLHCHHQVEVVQPSIAFDVASLLLYGTQAVPVRLKILLDRLLSVLRHEEVLQVLHGFGWTYEDYARGYILQDPSGHVLDRWLLATREEEQVVLQQFLRFGETKAIAQQLLLQDSSERQEFVVQSPRTESDIKKFIERTNRTVGSTTPSKHVYSLAASSMPPVTRPLFRQPSSSVSSSHSVSPTAVSPVNCSSPMSLSPLNRLQNMQPYDYRRDRSSPEPRTSEPFTNSIPYSSPMSSPATSTPAVSTCSAPTNTNHTSKYTTASSDLSGAEDIVCSEEEDNANSAINLTRSNPTTTGYLDSIFAAKKVRHLRKSANPMKRRWNPMVLATLNTNPATGKKRVQCHVCLKTFCDKGALKIHFSAVHLREMHKCTVEGCNMMFSSRRSRNRHSANPNPKLHTPNYRRKINPHDGRAANPYPIISPSGMPGFNNALLSGSVANQLEGDSSTASDTDAGSSTLNRNLDLLHSRIETNQFPETQNHSASVVEEDESPLPLTKKCRIDDVPVVKDDTSNCGDEGIDLTMKEDRLSSTKGVRKRKSQNPTKCPMNSDDDLQYVSTDDSSSDTYIDQDNDENGQLDSKSDYLSSDGLDSKDEDDEDLEKDRLEEEKLRKTLIKTSPRSSTPPLQCPPPFITTSQALTSPVIVSPTLGQKKYFTDKHNGLINAEMDAFKKEVIRSRAQDTEDICENPLRHLESLSLGAFNTSRNHLSHNVHVSSGVSYHAPGLGLGSSSSTTTASRADSPPCEPVSHVYNHTSSLVPPPTAIQLSGGPLNSDNENSLSDQQMPLLPVYRDASIVGSVDIPVDKENPRRCTACGKIFQNHFGVKTHYQNVHLKLMHKCTVEGCNAAFPSKRSRDRHSANLNLHRKLLSTSSEKPPAYFDKGTLYPFHPDATLRGDFFSRLYDPQAIPLSFADLYHSRLSAEGGFLAGSQYANHLAAMPGFHPAFMVPATTAVTTNSTGHPVHDGLGSGRDSPLSSISSAALSPHTQPSESPHPQRRPSSVKLEEELKPDLEGRYSCDICEKKFHESVVLREHYEKCHTSVLLQCTADGCNKVFLSRRTRNQHSDELHKEKVPIAS